MKKTILAITLPLIIYGCSESTDNVPAVDKFPAFEKSYVTATNTVISKSSEFSTGEMSYNAKFTDENNKVSLKDSFKYKENQNSVSILYDFESTADVDLSKYNAKDGIAIIKGTSNGSVLIDAPQVGEKLSIDNLLANAQYTGELNEKNKSFGYTAKIDNSTASISVTDAKVADLTLTDLSNNLIIHFNDDYTQLKSFKTGFDGKSISVKAVGPLSEELQFTLNFNKIIGSTEYVASPLKYNSIATVGDVNIDAASGDETIKATVSNLEFKTLLEDKNGLITANIGYNIGGTSLTKDKLAALDFGAFTILSNVHGIKNIQNWQQLFAQANALSSQNPEMIDESEAKQFLKAVAEIFTKDTRIEGMIENKLTIGDALRIDLGFQPTETFVAVLQQGPDALQAEAENKNPADLIDSYIKEFKFVGSVTEGYLISQYEKFLILDNQDPSKAADDIKGGIQMMMMIIAMQGAQLGVSPIEYKEGTLFVDVTFKDGKWNINGTTKTTAELFAAFQ